MTGVNDWPPQNFDTILNLDWQTDFYYKPYTRSTPYIYGIVFGYICLQFKHIHRTKGQKMPIWLVILGWLSCAFLCLITVYGLAPYWDWDTSCLGNTDCFTTAAAVSYAMFGRLAWSIGVSWIIFASMTGKSILLRRLRLTNALLHIVEITEIYSQFLTHF